MAYSPPWPVPAAPPGTGSRSRQPGGDRRERLVAVSGSRSPAERPTPATGENTPFTEAVHEARADIASGIERGGLRRDPLRYPLVALSTVVGLFPEFLDEIQRVRAPWTQDERRAAVADAVARMDTRLVGRMIQFNRWAIASALLLGVALAGGVGVASYWWGYRAAEDRLIGVPADLGAALNARDAAVWLDLMRSNDIARVNRVCAAQNGRNACSFVMWSEPVPPPRMTGTR